MGLGLSGFVLLELWPLYDDGCRVLLCCPNDRKPTFAEPKVDVDLEPLASGVEIAVECGNTLAGLDESEGLGKERRKVSLEDKGGV